MKAKHVFIGLGIIVVISIFGVMSNWIGGAAEVAQEEYSAETMLKKYRWFIARAGMIKQMDADIKLFEQNAKDVESRYSAYGEKIIEWPPHIQVQYNSELKTAKSDLMAKVSQRNNVVREYNVASDDFTWDTFREKDDFPGEKFLKYNTSY